MQTTDSSLAGFKTAVREQWDRAAAGWDRHGAETGAWLRPATERMLDLAAVTAGSRVLDVAAGSGEQSLVAARRVGPSGSVLATDLSPALVELARERVRLGGHANVELRVADGEQLRLQDAAFDAAVCRLGLMLFPRPQQGLREMHLALKRGGRACVMVLAEPSRNPCAAMLLSTACRHAGLQLPDPAAIGGLFSLGSIELLQAHFAAAGFVEITTERIDAPFHMASVDHYLAFVRESAGPVREILARLDDGAAAAAWAEMRERLDAFSIPSGWQAPGELLLAAGRRPS